MEKKTNNKQILLLTQKVNKDDPVLGFFHTWICEFAKHFETVVVVCLEKGNYNLPENIRVRSLGKETHGVTGIFQKAIYAIRFYRYIVAERKNYDTVFVHMNPEYVVLGGIVWRFLHKRIGLWYVHRQVTVKLRIAERLAHTIFSTTREAFLLNSGKVHFVGHGIDFSRFFCREKIIPKREDTFNIVHVGRITPIKNLDVLIDVAEILKNIWNKKFKITLVGIPSTEGDYRYLRELKKIVVEKNLSDVIEFAGPVSFDTMCIVYGDADISVNLTPSGGMDKAVLESIASGTIALSANKAFKSLFGEYADLLLYEERNPESVAEKIMNIEKIGISLREKIIGYLCIRIEKDFSLPRLISRITKLITNSV